MKFLSPPVDSCSDWVVIADVSVVFRLGEKDFNSVDKVSFLGNDFKSVKDCKVWVVEKAIAFWLVDCVELFALNTDVLSDGVSFSAEVDVSISVIVVCSTANPCSSVKAL